QLRHALALESKHRAGLCAHRNFQLLFAVQCLDHDVSTQSGLRKSNRYSLIKVATLSLKLLVFGNVDNHVEISGRSALSSSFAFSLHSQTRTSLDAGRDLHFHLLFALNTSCTVAVFARSLDHTTCT